MNTCSRLAAQGDLMGLRLMLESAAVTPHTTTDCTAAVGLAACNGHLAVVRYLVEDAWKYGHPRVDVTAHNSYAACEATINGHLEVVRYLVEEAPKHGQMLVDLTAPGFLLDGFGSDLEISNHALCGAALNDHLEMVRYLVEELPFITGDIPYSPLAMRYLEKKLTGACCRLARLQQFKEFGLPRSTWRKLLGDLDRDREWHNKF